MRGFKHLMAAMLLVALPFSSAAAALVTYQFEVELSYSEFPGIAAGDLLTGQIVYDTSVPDTAPADPESDLYQQLGVSGTGLTFSVGDLTGRPTGLHLNVVIRNGTFDEFYYVGAERFEIGVFDLIDHSGTAFANDSLPVTLALADFDDPSFYYGVDGLYLSGPITALQRVDVSAVPLPPAFLLFLSGLGAIFLVARGRAFILRPGRWLCTRGRAIRE